MSASYNTMDPPGDYEKKRISPIVIVVVCVVAAAIGIGVGIGIGYGIWDHSDTDKSVVTTTVMPPTPTPMFSTDAKRIRDELMTGHLKGVFYQKLANFTDLIGPRLIGTEAYNKAVDYVVPLLRAEGFDVHTELSNLTAGRWIRGEETLTLVEPRIKRLAVLALGWSKSTPPGGIEADVIVVRSKVELDSRKNEVKDKIVVFNPEWISYGAYAYTYRSNAANWAANYSAKAVLIRSAASKSAYNPHTGSQSTDPNTKLSSIPSGAITVEDAALLWRLQEMGQPIRLNLTLSSQHDMVDSNGNPFQIRTVIADMKGTEKPNEIVLVSGHLDTWDVGQGAMDDGCGVMLSWMVLTTLKSLKIPHKRTIRAVFWAGEETGGYGADQYYQDHHNRTDESHVFVMESDFGVFKPGGIYFTGSKAAQQIMKDSVMPNFEAINATRLEYSSEVGSDLYYWLKQDGIPGAEPMHEDMDAMTDYYFTYHHSNADMMTVLNSDYLDLTSIMYTTVAFSVAQMNETLPRS